MKIHKHIAITTALGVILLIQACAQSTVKTNTASLGPNDFPELINANIPGAPTLGAPQLIMGDTIPVRAQGSGWVAPAVYDINEDGKNDLLIGEFNSGAITGVSAGHFVRVYENRGTDKTPRFYDDFYYVREIGNLKESTGTPLSIYQTCCMPFTPRFADLDNDGYTDLLTGQYSPGYITWFRGSERGFLPGIKLEEAYDPIRDMVSPEFPVTDPRGFFHWSYSTADFGDFDNDGDQDMIIGGKAFRICENMGTASVPKFGSRELLFDEEGNRLESSHSNATTVPYVVDWDQDGVLDLLLTDAHYKTGNAAVTFYRGIKKTTDHLGGKAGLRFKAGVPLFTAKNGGKAFPGAWLNVYVTDWNNDGVNDLLIGTSIAMLHGKFNHELSWQWEHDTGISKKNNAFTPPAMKRMIDQQMNAMEKYQKESGLSDEELRKTGHMTKNDLFKNYYVKEEYKTLSHQGYVYIMLGSKR